MKHAHAVVSALISAAALAGAALPSQAQTKLNVQYAATLGGIPLGRGSWVVEIAGDRYSAVVSGGTTGLIRLFASGSGSASASGAINNGIFAPARFESVIKAENKRPDEARFSVIGGNARDIEIEPPLSPNPDRVPVTESVVRGIADPLTASLVRIPGNGDVLTDQACVRGASIFTGRFRFDVLTKFKRMEQVKAQKGYQGPAVVCAAYFKAIAGHVPDRGLAKHLQEQRDMEVWLVPIAGTRILAPYRIAVPTSFGLGALTATQFVTETMSAASTPPGARTQ